MVPWQWVRGTRLLALGAAVVACTDMEPASEGAAGQGGQAGNGLAASGGLPASGTGGLATSGSGGAWAGAGMSSTAGGGMAAVPVSGSHSGGGMAGSAGQAGSSAGGGGSAGTSADCKKIASEYAAELDKHLACSPGGGSQCDDRVAAAPGCECRIFIQPRDPFAIEHLANLADGWFNADCSMPSCPAKCTSAAIGTCQPDGESPLGGRCVSP
jgi:hypothetical protein